MTQEKKNKSLAVSLVVLVAATIGFYLLFSGDQDVIQADKNLFRADLSNVNRVTLESRARKTDLTFNGSRWSVNGTYDADRNMIEVLFATLQQAEPRRKVAESKQDSIAALLQQEGVMVSLWAGEQEVKKFYCGGNSSKTQAYFKLADASDVWLMTIPGYRVYVSGIFELDESGWRDKKVFAFNPRNFQSLKAEFPGRPADNFSIVIGPGNFEIPELPAVDTTRLNMYLDDVSFLAVDRYVASQPTLDSLANAQPAMIITVTDIANREFPLKLYAPVGRGDVPAILSGSQLAYFQRQKIQQVLRPKSWFAQKQSK